MNSATEQIGENQSEEKVSERRREFKLVAFAAPRKRKQALRLDVSDELLGLEPARKPDPAPDRKIEMRSLAPFRTEATIGLAIVAGLIIGYFLGRRRD